MKPARKVKAEEKARTARRVAAEEARGVLHRVGKEEASAQRLRDVRMEYAGIGSREAPVSMAITAATSIIWEHK